MSNPAKIIFGTLLGAGIGAAVARVVRMVDEQPEARGFADAGPAEPRETLKQRWQRAKQAGEEARAQKEEELRAYFRTKVGDPQAMRENPTL